MEKLFSQMLQHMINRSLEAEMQVHVGHEWSGASGGNPRNCKMMRSMVGELQIDTPRDRECTFEPQLVKKRQVWLAGMEEKIYANAAAKIPQWMFPTCSTG